MNGTVNKTEVFCKEIEQMDEYTLVERLPTVEEYQALRSGVGWEKPDAHAAAVGLKNSLYMVCVLNKQGKVVGCGRVIGDGALCFYLQDIIVLPEHQGRGLGKRIMEHVMGYVKERTFPGSFVCLMAAKGAEDFYLRYGFVKRPNNNYGPGMILTHRSTG